MFLSGETPGWRIIMNEEIYKKSLNDYLREIIHESINNDCPRKTFRLLSEDEKLKMRIYLSNLFSDTYGYQIPPDHISIIEYK